MTTARQKSPAGTLFGIIDWRRLPDSATTAPIRRYSHRFSTAKCCRPRRVAHARRAARRRRFWQLAATCRPRGVVLADVAGYRPDHRRATFVCGRSVENGLNCRWLMTFSCGLRPSHGKLSTFRYMARALLATGWLYPRLIFTPRPIGGAHLARRSAACGDVPRGRDKKRIGFLARQPAVTAAEGRRPMAGAAAAGCGVLRLATSSSKSAAACDR